MTIKKIASTVAVGLGLFGALLAGASAETLKIGVIAPLTGAGAPHGNAMAQAAKIAASEANATGGLDVGGKKYQVDVVAYDDQYKAAEAIVAYNRLVNQDGVKYMILLSSASTLAVKDNIENDKVVALTAAFTSKLIDSETKYISRLNSIPRNYVPGLIAWLKGNLKERRVVTVNPNDETGWEQARVDEKFLKENGFTILGNELFERTQKEFQPMLTKVIGLNVEIINLGVTQPSTAGLIVRHARELGYKGIFVKTGSPGPKDIMEAAGSKEAVEGLISMAFADPSTPGFQRIAAEYKKAIDQEPNQVLAPYYDAANALLLAIRKGGDVNDTSKTANAFAQVLPMKSIQGDDLNAGPNRHLLSPIYIEVIKDGKPVVVGKVPLVGDAQ